MIHCRNRALLIEYLGPLFLKRLKEAYAMRDKHTLIFQQFSSTFPPETVQTWEAMVLAWTNDKSKPNPYKEPAPCSSYRTLYRFYFTYISLLATTLQDVRLDLAKEEATEAARGRVSPHNATLTTFLTTALDLEEQQYALRQFVFFGVANPRP
jgi:hypothetical protein